MHPNLGWQLGFLGRGGPCGSQREEHMGKLQNLGLKMIKIIYRNCFRNISQLWWGPTWVGTKWLQASNILQRVNAFWVDVTWSERCASWIALPLLNGKACFCQGRKLLLLGKSVWSTWYTAAPQPQQVSFEIFWGGKSKGRSINRAHVLAPRKAGEWVSSSTHFSYHCFADQPHLKRSKAWPCLAVSAYMHSYCSGRAIAISYRRIA